MAAIVHSQMLKLYAGPRSISGSFGASPSQAVVTAYLSQPSCVLSANAEGVVEDYAPASTTIVVEVSGRTDTGNWTLSTAKSPSVGTVSVVGATISVSGMTDDAGWVDITASKAGYESVTRRFTLAKVRQKGGVRVATALPANPSEVGGELAIFLDVADPALRGMYGWSGTAWVKTGELLNGSVTADKLAADAIQATKFADGIEPVSIVSLLPNVVGYTGPKLVLLTTDNKLYRYTGSNWVKELPAEDLTGQLVADQLASNSVTTGKIQAGAVGTDQLAAKAVTATKMVLTDTSNVYPDYDILDSAFYSGGDFTRVASASLTSGAYALRVAASAYTVRIESQWFQVEPSAEYFVELSAYQSISGTTGAAAAYIEFGSFSGGETTPTVTRSELVLRRVSTTSSARADAAVTTTSNERRARLVFVREAGGTGVAEFGGPVIRRRNNAKLIVDGSIVATKIATDAVQTHHLLAGAVTAEKLMVNKLSAITADMGDVTAGTFTLSSTGYIRGGATNFSTGAGFWMGYDAGTYKLRAGTPGSSGFEWTGSAFNVRGPDGSITISSGVVDWDKIAGAEKPESGATRNAYRGGWTLGTVHKKGDIVIKDGSGWIAKLDHTADALNMPPTLPTESNTYWGLYAAKGDTGEQPVTGLLTNEAVTLAATSAGVVSAGDFTSYAKGVFQVYNGQTLVSPAAVAYSVLSQTGCTGTIDASGNYSVSAMSADTAALTLQAVWNGVTIQRAFTLSKSKAGGVGSQGAMGPTVTINPDRAATFTATDGALDNGQLDIVFTATVTGVASPTYSWSMSGFQTAPTASTTNSQTITAAQFGTSKSATVTCTVNPGGYKDTFTIVRLEKSTAAPYATVGADSSNLRSGPGVNMVFNGDYTDGLAGTTVGWRSGGNQHVLGRNNPSCFVQGEGTAYIMQPGTPGAGVLFDADILNGQPGQHFAVTPGKKYEISAWLNCHRCEGRIGVVFCDAAGTQRSIPTGSAVTHASLITSIADMRQSWAIVTAPATAVKAYLIIRGYNTGLNDPYVFFSRVYFGEAGAGQTEPSLWTPGRGISQITPSNVTTYIADAALGNAQIGGDIWSTNHVAGAAGWRIYRNGTAEFRNVLVRGDIEATSIKADAANIVNTLNVAGNAITVPVSADGTWSCQTATANFGGAPVALVVTGIGVHSYAGIGGTNINTYLRVYRNGELIKTIQTSLYYYGGGGETAKWNSSGAWVITDYPGSGSFYYTVTVEGGTSCSVLAIGVKR
jgi:hypothetical protein